MSLRPNICGECSAPLRDDQRYCLQCGARNGAPRVDPLEALGFEPGISTPPEPVATAPHDEPVPAGRGLPSPRLTAALAAATLVLGGLAGAALGPAPAPSLAAAPQRVVALVIPSAAPAKTTTQDTATDEEPPEDEGSSDTPSADDAASTGDTSTDDTSADDATSTTDDTSTTETTETTDTTETTPDESTTTSTAGTAPAHVWLVSLPAADATTAFGPASPLAALVAQGTLLRAYAPAGPTPAANQLALLGGQVPTADCAAALASCVLPAGETSLPDQVTTLNLTWKAYVEDAALRCAAAPDGRVGVSLFTTLTQRKDCAETVVGPQQLATDLKAVEATPALSLLVPATTDAVPALVAQIIASKAYKKDGVLVLAPDAPPPATDPAAPLPAVGALVLSPRATAAKALDTPTGPVALLRSVDELLGLDPLATAAQATAGALDDVLAPPIATASAASIFPPSHPSITTRRSS
jgi:hypothetical protein